MASTGWMAFAASMMIIFGALDTLVYSGLVNFENASDSVMLCKVKSWGKETISEMQGDMVCKGTVVKKTPEFNIPISPLWQIFFHFLGMASGLILYGMFSKSELPRGTLFAYFVPAISGLLVRNILSSFKLFRYAHVHPVMHRCCSGLLSRHCFIESSPAVYPRNNKVHLNN